MIEGGTLSAIVFEDVSMLFDRLHNRFVEHLSPMFIKVVAVIVSCLLLTPVAAPGQEPTGLEAALTLQQSLVDAIAKAEGSVVAIARVSNNRERFANGETDDPLSNDFVPNEFGAGVVLDRSGRILTCYHLLRDVEQYSFYVWSKKRPYRAKVLAADPYTDLAVLKVEANDLQPIEFGKAEDLKKGQIVIALGNPYGIARDGEASASWGIVSNLARRVPPKRGAGAPRSSNENLHTHGTLIQCDVRIGFGSSGGALVNLRGELIGLTTSLAALSGFEKSGGFAYPVDDTFKQTVEVLKRGQKPEHGFLGIGPSDLEPAERVRGEFGARINSIVEGTPAAQSGLRVNDVVTAVNGDPIYSRSDLMRSLAGTPAGKATSLRVVRGKLTTNVSVVLSKKYVDMTRPSYASVVDPPWRGMRVDDRTAVPPEVLSDRASDIDPLGCVAVVDVSPDSQAWKAGVRPNTFISHVGGTRVATAAAFYKEAHKTSGAIVLRESARFGNPTERSVEP